MPSTNTAVKDIYCPKCDARYPINTVLTLCKCGAPVLIDYDYDRAASLMDRAQLRSRVNSMWRYAEVLPVQDTEHIISLGEGDTPLLPSARIGAELGLSLPQSAPIIPGWRLTAKETHVKQKTITYLDKAGPKECPRCLAATVERARELKIKHAVVATTSGKTALSRSEPRTMDSTLPRART